MSKVIIIIQRTVIKRTVIIFQRPNSVETEYFLDYLGLVNHSNHTYADLNHLQNDNPTAITNGPKH
ncbi:hypothetical protein SHLI107390_08995 [Shewanella livingstonensis]